MSGIDKILEEISKSSEEINVDISKRYTNNSLEFDLIDYARDLKDESQIRLNKDRVGKQSIVKEISYKVILPIIAGVGILSILMNYNPSEKTNIKPRIVKSRTETKTPIKAETLEKKINEKPVKEDKKINENLRIIENYENDFKKIKYNVPNYNVLEKIIKDTKKLKENLRKGSNEFKRCEGLIKNMESSLKWDYSFNVKNGYNFSKTKLFMINKFGNYKVDILEKIPDFSEDKSFDFERLKYFISNENKDKISLIYLIDNKYTHNESKSQPEYKFYTINSDGTNLKTINTSFKGYITLVQPYKDNKIAYEINNKKIFETKKFIYDLDTNFNQEVKEFTKEPYKSNLTCITPKNSHNYWKIIFPITLIIVPGILYVFNEAEKAKKNRN